MAFNVLNLIERIYTIDVILSWSIPTAVPCIRVHEDAIISVTETKGMTKFMSCYFLYCGSVISTGEVGIDPCIGGSEISE